MGAPEQRFPPVLTGNREASRAYLAGMIDEAKRMDGAYFPVPTQAQVNAVALSNRFSDPEVL